MDSLADLGINLLAALIGFLVAQLIAFLVRRSRLRSVRRMWSSFAAERCALVVSPWDDRDTSWEPSGLLAMNDLRAVLALQRNLLALGHRHDVVESARLHDGRTADDVVLIGGSEVNRWTRSALASLAPGVDFHESHGIVDRVADRRYWATFTAPGEGTDVGLIVMAPSPFHPNRTVLVLAGHYSYATHAAARLVGAAVDDLAAHVHTDRPFELIFTVPVVRGDPQRAVVQVARNT